MIRALALLACLAIGCDDPTVGAVANAAAPSPVATRDPLPSWNEGATKQAIEDFVDRVTRGTSSVPVEDRIAVFDNDGTLWPEQPIPVEIAFALDRIKVLHPDWDEHELLAGSGGGLDLVQVLAATHVGMTTAEFARTVKQWIATAREPRFKRPYTEVVYQPMLELLAYLRANGFTTYLVSGGETEFMRVWAERAYGIEPEHVIGSRVGLQYQVRAAGPVLVRLPRVDLVDDKAGKPVGIQQAIGKRPIAAFGNSDGDFEMLEWTTSASGPRLGLLVHHTDAVREWAYDRDARAGALSRALVASKQRGWVVVDMQHDWRTIFPFESR
jgi:phosphoserine phosphatase